MKAYPALTAVCLALACMPPALAQSQPPAKTDPTAEEPVSLNAFHVSASSDVGYMATSTLAGTRLNTPLRDVGTAVSIVTKEFLNDVNANDATTLLTYTVSTEIGGLDGNYAGGNFGVARADQNGARAEPERNQRVRGLAAAELTRDFFLSDIPFDSYNTERVTINRGPNALLFGIGSPGGVINNSTIAPIFGENSYEVKVQIGQHGSHRESIDLNQVLIPRRLAIRGAALNEDTEYRQRPAWEKDRRVFGAVTAVLAENRQSSILGRTTLRANGEYGDVRGNPPNILPPNDGMSSWWSLPSPDLARYTGTAVPAYFADGTFVPKITVDNRNLPATIPASVAIPYFLHLGLIYSQPGDPYFGFANSSLAQVHGGLSRILYTPAANGRPQVNQEAARHVYSTANFPGFRIPSISNRRVFDFYDRLFTGDSNFSGRNFKAGTLTLEQTFWRERAGLEATYDFQLYRSSRFFPWGAGEDSGTGNADVIIDVSRYSSNDEPNPNLGRPYYRTIGMPDSTDRVQRDSRRLTGFLQLNARDAFGEGRASFWLGRHMLTGLISDQVIKTNSRTYGLGWDSTEVDLTNLLTSTIEMYRRQVTPVVYVGPSLLSTASMADVRLEPINVTLPKSGDRHTMFYYDPNTRQLRNAQFVVRRYLNSGNVGRREIDSSVASLQSYFLAEHIVTLVGVRRDRQRVFERVNYDNDTDPSTRDRLPTGDFNPDAIRLRPDPSDDVRGNTLTWSVVGRFPPKLMRLPLNSDLRLFYNYSENFNPVGARRNVFNELLPPPLSDTKEYGAIVELLGGKVSARFNLFKTTGDNFTYSGLSGAVNQAINNVGDWLNRMSEAERTGITLDKAGLAGAGFSSYAAAYRAIINLEPEPTRSITNYRIETVNGIPRILSNPIVGAVTTSGFVAEGWEVDLTANPAGGLRLMMNLSKQETVQSNIGADLRKIATEMFANINASPLRDVPDSPALGETSTYRQRYNSRVMVPLAAELAKEGTVSLEQRKWRVNSAVSYDFRGERLKGWGVGLGLRWQSSVATGYPTFVGADGTPLPDLKHPFLSGDEMNGDVWLSYKRRLFRNKIGWRIQLNVRNAIGTTTPIPVFTNPNGEIALVRVPPLPEWMVTNTFKF